jgi:hypothetical protein
MNITKARLKEIINEELQREMAGDPDYSVSGAEDLKRSIAQHQAARDPAEMEAVPSMEELQAARDELKAALDASAADPLNMDLYFKTIDVAEKLEHLLHLL